MEKVIRNPSPALDGKFKVVGVLPGEVVTNRGTVDLRNIPLELAEELHKDGFPYLEKISESKSEKAR